MISMIDFIFLSIVPLLTVTDRQQRQGRERGNNMQQRGPCWFETGPHPIDIDDNNGDLKVGSDLTYTVLRYVTVVPYCIKYQLATNKCQT